MRWVLLSVLLTLTLTLVVGTTDPRNPTLSLERDAAADAATNDWRHTTQGWQRASQWQVKEEPIRFRVAASIHPLVIGLLELLISTGALIAFSTLSSRRD